MKINASECIRQQLRNGLTKAADIIAAVKRTDGIDVKVGLVQNVKSNFTNSNVQPNMLLASPKPSADGNVNIDDVVQVKSLIGRMGKETLRTLAEVL